MSICRMNGDVAQVRENWARHAFTETKTCCTVAKPNLAPAQFMMWNQLGKQSMRPDDIQTSLLCISTHSNPLQAGLFARRKTLSKSYNIRANSAQTEAQTPCHGSAMTYIRDNNF